MKTFLEISSRFALNFLRFVVAENQGIVRASNQASIRGAEFTAGTAGAAFDLGAFDVVVVYGSGESIFVCKSREDAYADG